jgi:hypothetical protein
MYEYIRYKRIYDGKNECMKVFVFDNQILILYV